jgi:sugar fermentation stimulation protein A
MPEQDCYHSSGGTAEAVVDLGTNLVEAYFLERLNRFAALVECHGRQEMVHVANSGRMRELFHPGRRVLLRPAPGSHRKTRYDLALVDLGFALVSADARLPNALVAEGLEHGRLSHFESYPTLRREATFGESRLDLLLERPSGRCYIETKSVTLVERGLGLFPDAPTTRGVKHLHSLEQAIVSGSRAAVVFVVQREDATAFSTNDAADPEFSLALREAMARGVEAYAYRCRVTEREITLSEELPIELA